MNVRAHLSITTATVTAAMLAATLSACSNPPSGGTGTAGSSGQGAAGDTATGASGSGAGTSGASGTSGTAGVTGASGSGVGTSGVSGGTAGSGTAGTGVTPADGGAGAGTAGTGGGAAGAGGTVATGCGACPTGVEGHCDANATYPTYPGFELSMVEDFCTPLNLTTDKIWTYSDGAPADGDTWFGKSQIAFSNGQMQLTAIKQGIPAGYTSYSESDYNSPTGKPTGRHFLSGEFRTKYNNYRYGRYEVNYKTPVAVPGMPTAGGYLSTMFAFRTPKWITWNEVDLELEPTDMGHNPPSILKMVAGNVVNFANTGAGVPGYPGGGAFDADPMNANFVQTDFHTYAFEWTAAGVTWYADGKNIHNYPGGTQNGGNNPKTPSLSAKIMMNLWVFAGTHFGDPTPNVYPLVSTYEYFRFYKATGETYPCTPTPSCVSAADAKDSQNNIDETTYP
jgi:beta-glucanase (GH16 family)